MSLVDHLGELRTRLFRSILAVAVGGAIGFYFATPIREFLQAPLGDIPLQVLGVGDAFFIQVKIALVIGIILAMPVLLYQVWAFVSPGLTPPSEDVRPWIPMALVFFALGVVVACIVLPFALAFLSASRTQTSRRAGRRPVLRFRDHDVPRLRAGDGVPDPARAASRRSGIITSQRLSSSRRMVILGISIFAAVVTPGGDLVSPIVLGITMYVLFELTILFIKRSRPVTEPAEVRPSSDAVTEPRRRRPQRAVRGWQDRRDEAVRGSRLHLRRQPARRAPARTR